MYKLFSTAYLVITVCCGLQASPDQAWQPSVTPAQATTGQRNASHPAQERLINGLAFANAGDWDRAILEYDAAIELDPSFAEAFNHRGGAYFSKGDYARAQADYTEAIKLNPKFAVAYNNRGNARRAMKDYNGAIADLTKVIEIEPNSAPAYNNRGITHYLQKNDIKAYIDFSRAIKLDPGYVQAYMNRGSVQYTRRQYPAAIDDFTKAIELDPNNEAAYTKRGNIYHTGYIDYLRWGSGDPMGEKLGNADLEKVIDIQTENILGADNEQFKLHFQHFLERRNKRDYAGAIESLTQLIALFIADDPDGQAKDGDKNIVESSDQNLGALIIFRGRSHYSNNDYNRAIEDITRAKSRNQNLGTLIFFRGRCHYLNKDYDRAIEDLTKAIDILPEHARSFYFRSRAYSAKRDNKAASADFNKALALWDNEMKRMWDR